MGRVLGTITNTSKAAVAAASVDVELFTRERPDRPLQVRMATYCLLDVRESAPFVSSIVMPYSGGEAETPEKLGKIITVYITDEPPEKRIAARKGVSVANPRPLFQRPSSVGLSGELNGPEGSKIKHVFVLASYFNGDGSLADIVPIFILNKDPNAFFKLPQRFSTQPQEVVSIRQQVARVEAYVVEVRGR
jgi:hypothetical protein